MLIAWINRIDSALVSADSEVATLPGSNVQQPHVSRKWATESGDTSAALTIDMQASVACSLIAVLGSNLAESATLRLRASDADPAALATLLLDTGSIAAGAKTGYGAAYKSFDAVTARYWRLDLADATLADHMEVGRVFLGPAWEPSANQLWDWGVTALDESPVVVSYGGQEYPDPRPQRRMLSFELEWMSESEMYSNAFALARAAGVVSDVLAIPDIDGAFVSEQAVWGRVTASQPLNQKSTHRYYQKFSIKERL